MKVRIAAAEICDASAAPIRTRRVDFAVAAVANLQAASEARRATVMTKRGLFARCALGIVLATTGVSAADWNRYCNPRFGQCADIPAGFRADPPPENGDGLVYRDNYVKRR